MQAVPSLKARPSQQSMEPGALPGQPQFVCTVQSLGFRHVALAGWPSYSQVRGGWGFLQASTSLRLLTSSLRSAGPATWVASCAAGLACSCCTAATREAMKSSARASSVLLFSFSLGLSWLLRDFAKPVLQKLPCESARTIGLQPAVITPLPGAC